MKNEVMNIENIKSEVNMDITKEDLITVMVAEREVELKATRDKLQTEISKINKENNDIQENITDICNAEAEKKYRKLLDAFTNAEAALRGKKLEGPSELITHLSKTLRHSKNKGRTIYTIDVSYSLNNTKETSLNPIPVTKTITDLLKKVSKNETKVSELSNKLSSVSHELYELDSDERQFKAKIIRKMLSNAGAKGKQLLAITNNE